MRRLLPVTDWKPVGVSGLEPNADRAVREEANGLVVAGPGAGKTELLAQRACFLLQTGRCRSPRQILAISFKKDAAANLRARVEKRCGAELAGRFHSLTFDAFAKGLIDRFGQALPDGYRPTPDYQINFDIQKRMRDWLDQLVGGATGLTMADVSGISDSVFYKREFLGRALPIPSAAPQSVSDRAAAAMWQKFLTGRERSQLDFGMISRLAELLLRSNTRLMKALRQTYSHVFLDEFQDTTAIQYALTRSMFRNTPAVVTAVGDSKQRIMTWAGAVENIFERFTGDFGATRHDLVMNYRSAPRLVQIQQTLIAAIEPGTPPPTPADDGTYGEGDCRVLLYPDHAREASHLAELAAGWVLTDKLHPRDICVLTRNKPDEYTGFLIKELAARGIRARVETELQDLLVEPLVQVSLDILSLSVRESDRIAWTSLMGLLQQLRGLDESDPRLRRVENELNSFCNTIRDAIGADGSTVEVLADQLSRFFEFLGLDAFRRMHPQYLQDDFTSDLFGKFTDALWKYFAECGSWPQALTHFVGKDALPIITVHKSKGLEYHSVVFMGLEDSALWNFANQSDEERRAFFVAFSRARKRVLFTYCAKRERQQRSGGRAVAMQSRKNIGALYDLLAEAGVEEVAVQ
ncbi:MAG: ATP-dependent helicase [Gemmataceae bacterium]